MLRQQQQDVLPGVLDPNNPYEAAWPDKVFYLLNGAGLREIIVDENRSPFRYCKRRPPPRFLEPTAGLVYKVPFSAREKEIALNLPVLWCPPKPVYASEAADKLALNGVMLPCSERKARPTVINPAWKGLVAELKRTVTGAWEATFHSKGKEEGSTKKDAFSILLSFPQEVWEVILKNMDGLSYLRMEEVLLEDSASDSLNGAYVHLISAQNCRIPGFWAKSCFAVLHRQQFFDLVTSYQNVMEKNFRFSRDYVVPYDATQEHTCEDLIYNAHILGEKIEHGKLQFNQLYKLEKNIRTMLQFYVNDLDPASFKVMIGFSGTISYYCISGDKKAVTAFMEGLEKFEERRTTSICRRVGDHVRVAKIMHFPAYPPDTVTNPQSNRLPEVERLLIATCHNCTTIRSIDSARGGFDIVHDMESEVNQGHHGMDPILVILEDIFVLWHSPTTIEFHRLVHRNTFYHSHRFLRMEVENATEFWNHLCHFTQYYIPDLKKKRFTDEDFEGKQSILRTLGHDSREYYELKLISMRFGTDSISINNPCFFIRSEENGGADEVHQDNLRFQIHHQKPEYFYQNALLYREQMEECYSGCYGHDQYIFWNDKALAISSGEGLQWMFEPWTSALEGLDDILPTDSSSKLEVTHMCVITSDIIAACVMGNIVIFKTCVMTDPPAPTSCQYVAEPYFRLKALRLIKLDLLRKELVLSQMTFSYDLGKPYMACVVHKKDSKSPYDFAAFKVAFV